ncbi:OmpH family outer membrane protein [Salinisphaera sp. Q1T1-3]|uniref:OmpH family outer membrane protein n=1 Tax=Salinisphaera sp. Q1T1-3 TaxID=2321229 RepID=UPI001314DD02|nr:OmpH family outer membrane protein [Salinisphaera sp. Q1T1-3]
MAVAVLAIGLCLSAGAASAQPTRPGTKVGVVDLDRLVSESPQADKAKTNMAKRFAGRKDALERASDKLKQAIDQLNTESDQLSESQRNDREQSIREQKHELELQQSHYNDDVSAAEKKELSAMRADLRNVIDTYAREKGYDLILGNSVLYARDSVDITDAILDRLKDDRQ